MVTGIYADNWEDRRKDFWNELSNFADGLTLPWLVLGDFHCVRSGSEKRGGNSPISRFVTDFNSAIENAGLVEPRWEGGAFTWSNRARKRMQQSKGCH